jgi:hypothetical protein
MFPMFPMIRKFQRLLKFQKILMFLKYRRILLHLLVQLLHPHYHQFPR